MIYITHRLPEVMAICDRVTVLRDGQVVARSPGDEFDEEPFIFSMSGQRLSRLFPATSAPADPAPALEVESLHVPGRPGAVLGASDVSFSVAAGEIVGLAGLLGSGRSEILARHLRPPAAAEARSASTAARSPSAAPRRPRAPASRC